MIADKFSFIPYSAKYRDAADRAVDFVMKNQLLDAKLWESFVRVYRSDSDVGDGGWRNEYWGKMMRGACLTYMYRPDPALYRTLAAAVEGLLGTQRADGRISTYSETEQLRDWDVWGRKYVMTGLLHFYRICRDDALKERILRSVRAHADALTAKVGPGEGQIRITDTSRWWGGVNSSSILEPFVDLYTLCGDKKYLDFARYVISCGGCRDGDLIKLAVAGEKMPFEYPEQKAYETISFFEGVLAFYEITGEEYYLGAVKSFVDAVADTDVTVIGCCGCTHELFDDSAKVQTELREGIMQETCVTVTWMRMLLRLCLLTGEAKYYTRLERSALNALYGSVNDHMLESRMKDGSLLPALPFDSYSPLRMATRGRGVGGLKFFSFGGFYGCCACIAAAGTAIYPLSAVLKSRDGCAFMTYMNGTVDTGAARFDIETDYPVTCGARITIRLPQKTEFELKLRLPEGAVEPSAAVNGEAVGAESKDGFIVLRRVWSDGDEITLSGRFEPVFEALDGLTAVRRGPLVLARDADKEPRGTDLSAPVALTGRYGILPPEKGETLRVAFERVDGKDPLVMTDYASCGKKRLPDAPVSVWNDLTVR